MPVSSPQNKQDRGVTMSALANEEGETVFRLVPTAKRFATAEMKNNGLLQSNQNKDQVPQLKQFRPKAAASGIFLLINYFVPSGGSYSFNLPAQDTPCF